MVLATLAVAWLVSQVSPAWTTRYLGVMLGPMLLLRALGLARAGNARARRARDHPRHLGDPADVRAREQVERRRPAQRGRPELHKGDLVLSMQPEQGPLLAYHLEGLGGAPEAALRERDRGGRERPGDGLDRRLRPHEGRHAREEPGAAAC